MAVKAFVTNIWPISSLDSTCLVSWLVYTLFTIAILYELQRLVSIE